MRGRRHRTGGIHAIAGTIAMADITASATKCQAMYPLLSHMDSLMSSLIRATISRRLSLRLCRVTCHRLNNQLTRPRLGYPEASYNRRLVLRHLKRRRHQEPDIKLNLNGDRYQQPTTHFVSSPLNDTRHERQCSRLKSAATTITRSSFFVKFDRTFQ